MDYSLRRRAIPPAGTLDNPHEVNKLLSEYSLSLTYEEYRNLAFTRKQISSPSSQNNNSKNNENDTILPNPSAQMQIDDLLSKDLLKLSMQDRNAITEEIHGVQTIARNESPSMIQNALQNLQYSIDALPIGEKNAYLRGQNMYPNSYINTPEFRLRFLRCDLFDPQKAANRMVNFLDIMLDLFGDYILKRPILLSDFSWDELQVFRRGHLQLLPYRDRSGRRIFASVGGFASDCTLVARVKILLYLTTTASEDVETQRIGIIAVVLPGVKFDAQKESTDVRLTSVLFMKRVYENLPVRTCSIHFCFPATNPFINIFRTVFLMSMGHLRKRMQFHSGENVEILYKLKSYGIPVELIPLTETGNIKTTYLKQWMKLRKIIDDAKESEDFGLLETITECPGSKDTVFRPGTSVSYHPGNVRFRCLLESIAYPDEATFKITQAEMAQRLVREIEATGGRFLKWDNRGYWVEVKDPSQKLNKVALSIRDFRYKTKAQRNNRQNNASDTYLFCQSDGGKRKREEDLVENNPLKIKSRSQVSSG